MSRRLSAGPSVHDPFFQRVARAIARIPYQVRGLSAVAMISLTALALGTVPLTTDAVTRAWIRVSGSKAGCPGCGVHALYGNLANSTRRPASAATTSTIASFDAPGAGTATLQGTIGASINAAGDIAGVYLTTPNVAHGFIRVASTGTITEFDAPGAGTALNQGTFAVSIDAADDVAGMYADSNNAYHGFVRAGATGTITQFDVTGAPTTIKHRGTTPLSINAAGDITGLYVDANAVRHGFVRTVANGSASFTTFNVSSAGTSATQGTIPMNIDASGNITGFYIDANGVFHGFLRAASGTITAPIDAPGAAAVAAGHGFTFAGSLPIGLDASGDIAGIFSDANSVFHGFVRDAGGTTSTFDVTGAGTTGLFPGTTPTSVNGAGDIAGVYEDANGVSHGFVRAASDGTITAPIDAPGAGTTGMIAGTVPFSINAADDLTGSYADSNGTFHGFVLTSPAAATPAFSPAPGSYSSAQTVTISDATTGASIYYTTDGTTPTTGSTLYSGSITVNSTETIEAIAAAAGFSNSAVATATYTINAPVPDFQVSVGPTTLTIVAGQSGEATFTVTPENGFNSPVNFACNGLPAGAACSFSPPSVTPDGAPITSTLTVTTTAPSAALRLPRGSSWRLAYATLFPLLAFIFGFGARRREGLRGLQFIGFVVLLIAAAGLTACGGGNNGTPIGTSNVSVSASAAGGSAINHAATLTIIITH